MQSEKPSFARFERGTGFNMPAGNVVPRAQSVGDTPSSERSVSQSPEAGARSVKTGKIFDAVITVSLVALFFGLPLFFTGLTFQGIAFEKQMYFYVWLLVGIVAWVSKGVTTGEMRIRRTPIDIPIILFWLFYVIASFFSVDRWHSFWGFFGDPSRGAIAITAFVLSYYFILSHFTLKRFSLVFGAFLTSSFILVVWTFLALMNIQFLPEVIGKYAPISLIGSVSTLAIYLGLLIPLFLTGVFALWKDVAVTSDTNRKKKVRLVLTGLLFVGLALALFLLLALYAYVSWIVVLGGLSFFMVYILAQIIRPTEQWTWAPMLVFAMVLAFLMIGKTDLVRVNLPVEVAPNVSLSWQIAKESLKENFFAGAGPANYGYAFSMFRPMEYNLNTLYTLRFYQGTGLFFESLSSIGAAGTVLLLVLWLSFLSVGLYLLTRDKDRNKIYSLGFWTAVVMFFLAAFTSPLNGTLLILGVLLGTLALGVLLWESGSEERFLHLSFKAAPKFALALAFIFMVVSAGVAFVFVFMGKVFIADVSVGKAARMAAVAPSRESAGLLTQAVTRYPQEGRYLTRLGQEYMSLANVEANKPENERDINTVALFVRQAVSAGEQGRALMPNDVMAAESLALIYENGAVYASDALPKAEEFYKRASELEPQNPLFYLKLGQIKRNMGDAMAEGAERTALYNEAAELYQKSIDKKKDLAAAYYNLAIIQARLKDLDTAVSSASTALGIDKTNLNYQYNLGALYQLRDKDDDLKNAEAIFKDILTTNEKLIDVRISLGLLYEKQNKRDEAVAEYRKVLTFLPEGDPAENIKQTREQVQKLIDNVLSGVGNLRTAPAAVTPVPAAPIDSATTPASTTPAGPNVPPLTEPNQ